MVLLFCGYVKSEVDKAFVLPFMFYVFYLSLMSASIAGIALSQMLFFFDLRFIF